MMFSQLKLWLLGAFGLLATFFTVYLKGRSDRAEKEALKQVTTYVETRKRIDETSNPKRDARAARQWLRDNGK